MKKIIISIFCMIIILAVPTYCGFNCIYVFAEEVDLSAKAAVLIDYNSNEILFEKDADEQYQDASMVKHMTIFLTVEAIDN